ncbi:MAG TPA: PD-(D/E)XK nuclease family protein [Gammaproteobacteria bacterium]|nr:PD-(D/E)XK nuclease family protein [Gammaproteobacteria bacterium]
MKIFNFITTSHTTILTPNRRLAAILLNQLNQFQIEQKKTCWRSFDILPLPSWLQRLWNEFSAKEISSLPLLLSANQKSILWEIILRQSPASDLLLQINETARLAESAYELLKLWEINFNDSLLSSTEDGQILQQWVKQFQKLCKKNNWMDNTNLVPLLKEALSAKKITLPEQIILAGFTEISPQHFNLIKFFEESGTKIIHYHRDEPAESVKKIGLSDEETEIRTMARWAKSTLEASQTKKPYLIGCVVPQLETLRDSVLQIFSEVFAENNTFTLDHTLLPFNISAGKSLSSFPVIRAAIDWLKLKTQSIQLETISDLLKSPFLGEAEQEKLKRAYFENRLKQANMTSISMENFFSETSSCPALTKRLKRYFTYLSQLKPKQSISAWIKNFLELLKILGWPGERSLNSQEYQVTQRWLDLLLEFSTFDTILKPQTFSNALNWLVELSEKTIFQPQSPEAPIQILGVLEAAELPFEHLWMMGFDDSDWPAAPKPHPLIPQRLQKKFNMPHATTERELIYCEQLVKQLKCSAKHIIFSYSEKNEDIDLRPSSFLNDIEKISLNELYLSDFSSPAQKIFATRQIEIFNDELAPAIQANENIHGGTHIFKQQAACPFKAFSELRLHARFIDTPTLGLRAIDRGNIVHKALELIWKSIKNSTTLITMPEQQLKEIVHTSAKEAIQQIIKFSEQSNTRYLALELQRLEKLLLDWLKLESNRPEFKVVLQEHEMNMTFGDIPITIRVDRIDELADGSQLIIDYKTGKHNEIKKWFSDRPEEPQLPLYCLLSGENISGIAFGQIHPDDMTLLGVSKKNINIKSIKTLPETHYASATLWEQQLEDWKKLLENLSQDFQKGIANVDPKDINQVCKNCNLHTFCRVHERC